MSRGRKDRDHQLEYNYQGWDPLYSPPRHRSRWGSNSFKAATLTDTYGNQSTPISVWEMWDEQCTDRLHPGPPFQNGGPLDLHKRTVTYDCPSVGFTSSFSRALSGKMVPSGWLGLPITSFPTDTTMLDGFKYGKKTDAQLDILGSTGWARNRPGSAEVDAAQFFAELNRLPSIDIILYAAKAILGLKKSAKGLLNVGNRYLDGQFGWEPFLKEIRQAYQFSDKTAKALEQLRRDNGKRVRRQGIVLRRSLPELLVGPVQVGQPLRPVAWGEMYGYDYGYRQWTNTFEELAWFSAGFRYNIPDLGSSQWPARAKEALWGLNPTPALIWEITPWSWLVDYFTNLGDVLSNMSENAAENLVADYAFVMARSIGKTTLSEKAHMKNGWAPHSSATWIESRATLTNVYKQRRAASPYNFGVTSDDISTRQKLILAALGISRLGW